VVHRQLAHAPLTGFRVVLRRGENVPPAIVQLRKIAAIVVAGPGSFLAVQRVPQHGLGGPHPVLEFPGALKLVDVFGADVVEVFPQQGQ